jgi:hypothetical protein
MQKPILEHAQGEEMKWYYGLILAVLLVMVIAVILMMGMTTQKV